jgi:tetratricopeptide (TPR) repeat protein
MSARTIPFNSDQPRKRAKTTEGRLDSEISSLNESGVLNLQHGMIDDAQHFFVKALDCFTVKHRRYILQEKEEVVQRNDFGQAALTTQDNGIYHDVVTSLKSPTLNETLEYDEGVRAYVDTMIIGEGISDSMQSAILYYNVAQTFVHLNKYNDAMSWFELALMCIKFVPMNNNVATAAVKIRHNLGYCCYRLAKSNEARYCFEKALNLAEEQNLGFPYSAAARNAYAVALFYSATPSNETLSLLDQSLEEYRSIFGNESREVAAVLNNIGRVHFAKGNFHHAVLFYKQSLNIRRQKLSDDSIDVAATICSAGQAQHRLGELKEALVLYEEFLALSVSGKYNKRDVAIIAKSAGEIYHKQAVLGKAKAIYEKALDAAFAGFGHIHPEIASIYNRLGNLYYETNNLGKALECYKEGLTIEQLTLPACHARIVVTIANIAQIHYQLGEYAMALARYNQVYNIQLKAHGPRSLEVSKALATMGEMEYKMRRFEAAFTLFQDVLVIQREYFGDTADGLEIASTMNSIGIVACAQGEFKIAQSCFDSSLKIRRKELGDHKDTATLWYNLATVNEEIGDEDNAITMYKECLRIERHIADTSQKCDVVDSLQRLGRLHQRRGELDEALQYFKEALDKLRTKGDEATFAVAKFLNLIGNVHLQRAEISEMMHAYTEASRIYRESASPTNEVLVIAGYYMYGLSKLHPLCPAVA